MSLNSAFNIYTASSHMPIGRSQPQKRKRDEMETDIEAIFHSSAYKRESLYIISRQEESDRKLDTTRLNKSFIKCPVVNGVFVGPAIITFPSGAEIHCTFIPGGVKHGRATQYSPNGTRIEFEYEYGKRLSEITEYLPDGSIIKCRTLGGKKLGDAIQTFVDGSVLRFNYHENIREGNAVLVEKDGTTHEFIYVGGMKVGKATTTFVDVRKKLYKSQDAHMNDTSEQLPIIMIVIYHFVNNIIFGKAKEINRCSTITFFFVKGVRQGEAREVFSENHYIEFSYVNGYRTGKAVEMLANNSTITFFYEKNIRNGEAILELPNGMKIYFNYSKGIIKRNSEVTFAKSNGDPVACVSRFKVNIQPPKRNDSSQL